MGTSDQGECRPDGTIYGSTRLRLPPDRQLRVAVAIGAGGVALGALLASGVLSAGRGPVGGQPRWTDPLTSRSGGAAAGLGQSALADRTPSTASTAPSAAAPSHPPTPTPTPPTPASTGPTGPATPLAGGIRGFRSVASALCLAAPVDGFADAYQMACSAAPGPRWLPAPVRPNVVALVSVATGHCLAVDVPDSGDGTPVRQRPCAGGEHQQWRVVPAGGGGVPDGPATLTNVYSGRCIALPVSPPIGPPLRQTTCRGTPDQQWVPQSNG